MQDHSTVHVYRASPRTLEEDIGKILDTDDFRLFDCKKTTYVKINANYDRIWPGCNTSKWFLDALFKNLRGRGFEDIKVIEGDLKLQPATKTIQSTTIDELLNRYGIEFLPIEDMQRKDELPVILNGSQLISTPVLHTHTFAVISVASKNLYGLLPIYRERYHQSLSRKLLELTKKVRAFTIVDGTVGLEGGSMRMGTPVRTDLVLAGWNPITVDAIAARIMGFTEDGVPLLKLARDSGRIGIIDVQGDFAEENLPRYHFHYSESALSNLDLWLRGNKITGPLFEHDMILDRLANRARRKYTESVYRRRYRQVSVGSWTEYNEVAGTEE